MKVYGVRVVIRVPGVEDRQPRLFVAARSRAAAVRALNEAGVHITNTFMSTYGGETWNELEVSVATANPGQVFAHKKVRGARSFDEVVAL